MIGSPRRLGRVPRVGTPERAAPCAQLRRQPNSAVRRAPRRRSGL